MTAGRHTASLFVQGGQSMMEVEFDVPANGAHDVVLEFTRD